VGNHPNGTAIAFDVSDEKRLTELVQAHDVVVSMLPAHMHIPVAKACVQYGKHMVTASYISDDMRALDDAAKAAGVVLINEMGVDPGIDHLSAMRMLDGVRNAGGEIILFESFTGGLVAPECEGDNPWKYKFTWNPRNVVLAGSGGAVKFKQEGLYKYIPYHQLFRRTEFIDIDGYGRFEAYANRDSLKYRDVYGLGDALTVYRGTLRRPGFCRGWDVFVKLGMTDDSYTLENSENMTFRQFTNTFLAFNKTDSVELKLMHYLKIDQDDDLMERLKWLGIFDNTVIGLKNATPAQILQHILEKKWSLNPQDKDMVVMYHKMGYVLNGEKRQIDAHMVAIGSDSEHTAMAKTVGLPAAIATKYILTGVINTPGVQIPISPEIYNPVLDELEAHDIHFVEKEVAYEGY
jgi:saccharopine dehydrogenase-like NADP-dependent oxidoreductase